MKTTKYPRSDDDSQGVLEEAHMRFIVDASVSDMRGTISGHNINIAELEITVAKQDVRIENIESTNQELKSINQELNSTNQELKSTNQELKSTVAEQNVKIADLVTDKKKNFDLIFLFDLICLYRFYIVQPNISASAKHVNWGGLCEVITKATDDHEDGLMSDDDYSTLRTEWSTYSPNVDIFSLRKWSTARHGVAHSDIRSVSQQQNFIAASKLQIFADSDMNNLRLLLVASLSALSVGDLRRNN